MRTLLLMRHAKSDWTGAGRTDKERPLNERGRRAAPRMGRWLHQQNYRPDLVLSSSSARTRETWDRMRDELFGDRSPEAEAGESNVEWLDTLYLAEPRVIWEAVRDGFSKPRLPSDRDVSSLMILGHNPGMELLISALAWRDLSIPTGAVAVFQSEEPLVLDLMESIEKKAWNFVELQFPKGLTD